MHRQSAFIIETFFLRSVWMAEFEAMFPPDAPLTPSGIGRYEGGRIVEPAAAPRWVAGDARMPIPPAHVGGRRP